MHLYALHTLHAVGGEKSPDMLFSRVYICSMHQADSLIFYQHPHSIVLSYGRISLHKNQSFALIHFEQDINSKWWTLNHPVTHCIRSRGATAFKQRPP